MILGVWKVKRRASRKTGGCVMGNEVPKGKGAGAGDKGFPPRARLSAWEEGRGCSTATAEGWGRRGGAGWILSCFRGLGFTGMFHHLFFVLGKLLALDAHAINSTNSSRTSSAELLPHSLPRPLQTTESAEDKAGSPRTRTQGLGYHLPFIVHRTWHRIHNPSEKPRERCIQHELLLLPSANQELGILLVFLFNKLFKIMIYLSPHCSHGMCLH